MTDDLTKARLRALCCPGGCRAHPATQQCDADRTQGNLPLPGTLLAAHDAVLEAAGVPISKLIDGTWQAVPREPDGDAYLKGILDDQARRR